jgi:hypothetical protein
MTKTDPHWREDTMTTTPNDPTTAPLGHPAVVDRVFLTHSMTGRGNEPVNGSLGRQGQH